MKPLHILVLGAHPDDADIKAGGTAAKWCELGHRVQMVSVTNGASGHQTLRGEELASRRRAEAKAAGAVIGAEYEVLAHQDGELLPTLEARFEIIRLIRTFGPDLILTHRFNDYHPDHRYTAQLVQDAAYMITVPAVCPETPHLERNPVIMYLSDDFRKPCPFEADVVVDITDKFDTVVDMLHCHTSQFYEWLPYNSGQLDQVPTGDVERKAWLYDRFARRISGVARRNRDLLERTYGEAGETIQHAEAFETSEYGAPLTPALRAKLFPFVPSHDESTSSLVSEWADLRDDE